MAQQVLSIALRLRPYPGNQNNFIRAAGESASDSNLRNATKRVETARTSIHAPPQPSEAIVQ